MKDSVAPRENPANTISLFLIIVRILMEYLIKQRPKIAPSYVKNFYYYSLGKISTCVSTLNSIGANVLSADIPKYVYPSSPYSTVLYIKS